MNNEPTRTNEKCMNDKCIYCRHCSGSGNEKSGHTETELKYSVELYNKEAEHYYFYYLENKAS